MVAPSGEQFEIALGDQRVIVTEVGGALRSYSAGGHAVLDGFEVHEVATSGRGQVLIPWPNRLEDGSYEFDGGRHQLPLDEPTPPPVVLPTLTEEHQAVARQVHTGQIACELGQSVLVEADAANPGFFFVTAKGQRFHMAPGLSRIGAVRLEDVRGGALWLQIANKSMLMNTRLGQRMADECMSEHQSVVAAEMKKNPPRSLLD